jgi:hypothetical protein
MRHRRRLLRHARRDALDCDLVAHRELRRFRIRRPRHAEGRKRGGGKTIFFSDVEVRDDEGRLIATAVGTFLYVSATPVGVKPSVSG